MYPAFLLNKGKKGEQDYILVTYLYPDHGKMTDPTIAAKVLYTTIQISEVIGTYEFLSEGNTFKYIPTI